MDGSDARLSEEEARRIWRRAADLQARAAAQLENRSQALVEGSDAAADGYRLEDVRQAAVEAGIAPEFVDAALGEGREPLEPGSWLTRRLARAFVGRLPPSLRASRVLDASPPEVYQALQALVPAPPYHLTLVDIRGAHPLEGGVMVFEVPPPAGLAGTNSDFVSDLRFWADIRTVTLAIRPIGQEATRTEVTVAAWLDRTRRVNMWVGGAFVGSGTVLGAIAGVGVSGPLGLVAAPVVWMAGTASWRALARWGIRRGHAAMEKLIQALAGHLRTEGAFGGLGKREQMEARSHWAP